jgi:putative phosphoribosyl transferase
MTFKDRIDAGKQVALRLLTYKNKPDVIVLGLTRGGVIPALYVARELNAPLDIIIACKISKPKNPELALGALTEDGTVKFNDLLMQSFGLHEHDLKNTVESERDEVARRTRLYRSHKKALDLKDKTVIIVDDGIATGATMRASIASARSRGARHIVVAVPVAPAESLDDLQYEADEIVCVHMPRNFLSISTYYQSFPQVSDQEVIGTLRASQQNNTPHGY